MSITDQIQDEGAFLRVAAAGTCDDLDRLKEHVLTINSAALSAGLARALVIDDAEEWLRHCPSRRPPNGRDLRNQAIGSMDSRMKGGLQTPHAQAHKHLLQTRVRCAGAAE